MEVAYDICRRVLNMDPHEYKLPYYPPNQIVVRMTIIELEQKEQAKKGHVMFGKNGAAPSKNTVKVN